MVHVKLLSNENNMVRYSYQPEIDGKPGVLRYDKLNENFFVDIKAEKDITTTVYREHVLRMIKNNINSLNLLKYFN